MTSFFHSIMEKKYVKLKLKTFSQLKSQYSFGDSIYRAAKPERFSKKSTKSFEKGIPTSRPDSYVPLWSEESDTEDKNTVGQEGVKHIPQIEITKPPGRVNISEPLWYACNEASAKKYCKSECMVYKYTPLDKTTQKGDKLVYLDLTGNLYSTDRGLYELDKTLMKIAYDYLYKKYAGNMMYDESDKKKYLCVDHPCENTFSLDEISSAYGNYGGVGIRNSEFYIDRFFTLTLFEMLDTMGLVDDKTRIVGYFHADLITGNIDSDGQSIISSNSFFSTEFAIKYGTAIDKTRIRPEGLTTAVIGGTPNSKKHKRRRNRKKTRKLSNRTQKRNTIRKRK